jgi:Zn-dependent M28 family amino/carboxypeptidase
VSGPGAVTALSFSDAGEASGAVVFAGYGLVVPDSQNFGYDSYQGLDVKDKIVIVLRYFPEDADQKTRAILARYSELRYKALAARQRGAKGMVVVTGPRSPNAGAVVPMSFDTAISGSGLVAASLAGEHAEKIFAGAGKQLEAVQKELDSGNPHVAGFAIPNLQVTINAKVIREQQTGSNVVAYLPATTPTTGVAKPWIAAGAHYDHLGRGGAGNSLADKQQANEIHHGADDNASGTATVLALGEAFAKLPRKRNLLLAFWSGEELGLLGSAAFVAKPPVPADQMAAYLNFDMVGRVSDNKLTVQATGTSAMWPKLLEQANVAAGFDLVLQEDPYQPTDVGSFNGIGVPCLTFFTGAHSEYHKPSDTADKINYEDLDRVGELATSIIRRLMDAPDAPQFTKVEQKTDTGGGRAGLRLFTGTIPDYASDVKGLLLGGVIGGGPAEQAGLAKGDVIIEIAGQSITNIYDYTYALELLKIGQPAKVIYMRGGERRETTLTPAARK